ncbi:MAG: DUF4286 family protein [Bacteroidota bacterium]
MILYNVTLKIDHEVHRKWLAWMKVVYLPNMMKTGLFLEYTISRLLGTDEVDGFTYSIQYLTKDFSDYQIFQEKHAARMQRALHEEYEGKYVVFRTIMKVVERGE